jgi:hypothetical protein
MPDLNMDASTSPSTAFEQASAAYERLKQRRLRAAASERRTRMILLAVAMLVFGALVLGAVTYRDRLMQSLQSMTQSKTSPGKSKSLGEWMPQSLRDSIANQPSDEDRKFVQTRKGQVRSFVKGNTCRELQFNNDAGQFVGETFTQCEADGKRDSSVISQTKRLNAIRDSFAR